MPDPKQIDHFQVIRELGRGGMGKVYLARDLKLDRNVAIKVVTIEAQTEAERIERGDFLERLKREAKIAAALDHPGIVTIYHVGDHGNEPYIVMQFIDGPTLESLARTGGGLDRAEAMWILGEVAAALDYAHSNGVIHRDIKPPNIMIAGKKLTKVCDFGIAKFVASNGSNSVILGTQAYMSPERLQGIAHDGKTDQWSLAIMAYEILTGRLPFRGQNWMWQIMTSPIPADPALSPRMAEVLNKGLAKDSAGRYPACSDFVRDLALAMAAPHVPAVRTLRPGDTKVNPKDRQTYVWIPPGTFQMGCSPGDSEAWDAEKPVHQVTISRGFWMGQTPVTQEAWQRVMGTNPSNFIGPKLPVEAVSWDEARKYCEEVGMRLPTEAEWEYAARAGTSTSRYGKLDKIAWYRGNSSAWYKGNSRGKTHDVGGKQANAWGLYDMLGNVCEWVADRYGKYPPGNATDPEGPASGTGRSLRGGSFLFEAVFARVSSRIYGGPEHHFLPNGFRCVGN